MPKRVTYRGVGLFVGGEQVDRATAFGTTGNINKEDIFELGNSDIAEVVDDINEVTATIDVNEIGSTKLLERLSGKKLNQDGAITFSKDFEYASTDVWNYIAPSGASGETATDGEIYYTEFLSDCYLTSYNADFSVDGNATESFSLVTDKKSWLLGNMSNIVKVGLSHDDVVDGKWKSLTVDEVLEDSLKSVYVNGKRVREWGMADGGDKIAIQFDEGHHPATDATVEVYIAANEGAKIFKTDEDASVKRRGHIEVHVVTEPTVNASGMITDNLNDSKMVIRVQNASIDASLGREDIAQLGNFHYYDRPLTLPIDVSVSLDVIFGDLDLFAKLVGEEIETATELNIDEFQDNVGLVIKVKDKRDIDENPVTVKEYHVARLIPTDEAFNISLDGQATQTFSFRSHELAVVKKTA